MDAVVIGCLFGAVLVDVLCLEVLRHLVLVIVPKLLVLLVVEELAFLACFTQHVPKLLQPRQRLLFLESTLVLPRRILHRTHMRRLRIPLRIRNSGIQTSLVLRPLNSQLNMHILREFNESLLIVYGWLAILYGGLIFSESIFQVESSNDNLGFGLGLVRQTVLLLGFFDVFGGEADCHNTLRCIHRLLLQEFHIFLNPLLLPHLLQNDPLRHFLTQLLKRVLIQYMLRVQTNIFAAFPHIYKVIASCLLDFGRLHQRRDG